MEWKILETEDQLNSLVEASFDRPQAIFKHSTRCSISLVAKTRLDKANVDAIDFHYLDLISYRNISNLIAEKFSVEHESPQIIVIKDGSCIFDESHSSIIIEDIVDSIS